MALVEALSENKELCDLVEKLTAELDRLSEVEKKAEEFTQALQVSFILAYVFVCQST